MANNDGTPQEAPTGEEQGFFETTLSDADLAAMSGDAPPEAGQGDNTDDQPPAAEPPPPGDAEDDQSVEESTEEGEIFLEEGGQVRDAKTGRFVPHAALHKERERRKEIESAYQEELQKRAALEGRIEEVNRRMAPVAEGQKAEQSKSALDEELIDPEEDIFGAFDQQRRIIQELQKQSQQTVQRQTEQTQYTQVQQQYVNDAVAFSKSTPDFADAYRFIKEGFHKELELQGIADPNERESFIKREELGLVQNAFAQGRSPSEIIYNMALNRGFTKSEAPPPKQNTGAHEKLEGLKQAQAASNQVAQAGAGSSQAGVTYETLADMSDDEMYDWAQKNPAQFKKMFSGA